MRTPIQSIKYVFTHEGYIMCWLGFTVAIIFKLNYYSILLIPIYWIILEMFFTDKEKEDKMLKRCKQ